MAKRQPSSARGGNTRKELALAKRGKAARQTKSKAMMKDHSTSSRGNKRMSWLMSAGK